MKYLKSFEEIKVYQKHYDPYYLLNLVSYKYNIEEMLINLIDSGQFNLNLAGQVNKKTALIYAMINRYEKVFDSLIKAGANLDSQDENGNTALILAAYGSNGTSGSYFKSMIEKLIDAGADWNIKQSYTSKENNKDFLEHIKDEEFKRHIIKKYHKKYEEYLIKKDSYKYNI